MPTLPSGTVTFLFTDIEGSTRLWEAQPEAMRVALARHDALMRAAIEQHDGHVFKTIGDAFCAAFHTAPEALNAALAAQQVMISEPWPEGVNIKVRMALHTGAAEVRDNDYFGQPLNRVARLLSVGYGGQVLISAATQELVRDTLPPSVSLKVMGEHRLRDLNRPEQVFQILHPDLPSEFPPLQSMDHLPNNLPRQLTSFIGRKKEMAEIGNLLNKTDLLTLTGSGGCGKTRMALQVAVDVLDQYADGVWLVELASLADPALVPQTVASILGLTEQAGRTYMQTLIDYLKPKRLLLVLDNCEHLLAVCAQLSDALLHACPQIKIVVTSREGLGMVGEQTYRVPSLALPDLKETLPLEHVSQYEAVHLFIERATSSKADFVVTNANAPALVSICYRLDGIPLALELAAARVRSLALEEINTRLDNRFLLLTGGNRTALPRQQTLRATIDWSYNLLNAQERLLLARLSVFAGGWTLNAAEAVCKDEGERKSQSDLDLDEAIDPDSSFILHSSSFIEEWEVLDLLTGLVDKSLVIAKAQDAKTRYRLLETVRQYARDRLGEIEEVWTVRERHRDHFLALAEEAKPKLRSAEQPQWLDVLEEEHDNLRLALTFCLEAPEGGAAGLRLGAALQEFWWIRGHLSEGRQHLASVLSRPMEQGDLKPRADALHGAGNLARMQGDYAAACAPYEESLTIKRELGDKQGIAYSLMGLGLVTYAQCDYDAARARHQESLTLFRELRDKRGIAYSLGNLGIVAFEQGDYDAARALQEESVTIRRELGDKQGIAVSLMNLGNVAYAQGDYVAARARHQESLTLFRELGDKGGIAASLGNLGIVAQKQGDYDAARALQEESLTLFREFGNKWGIAISLDAYAFLNNQEQQAARAARLWGAVTSLREAIGLPRTPNDQEQFDREIIQARSALGEATFVAAFEEGRAMSWEEAVALALGENEM